jgi:hypothetical protein
MLRICYKTQTVDDIAKNTERKLLQSYLWYTSCYANSYTTLHADLRLLYVGWTSSLTYFVTLALSWPMLNLLLLEHQKIETEAPSRLTTHHPMKMYGEIYVKTPSILNLNTRWRSVIIFIPWSLYLLTLCIGRSYIIEKYLVTTKNRTSFLRLSNATSKF